MTIFPGPLTTGCGCDDPGLTRGLISLDDALNRVASQIRPVARHETLALEQVRGRCLTEDLRAQEDMPRFDHAAMDGYAIKTDDLIGPGPWHLPVKGRVAAGDPVGLDLPQDGACRIFTGAPIPPGYDCVVMQEAVTRLGHVIVLHKRPVRQDNIRFRGEELGKGETVLAAGTVMTPRAIAAAAAAGFGALEVTSRIRVTVLASGSEIKAPGSCALDAGQIWDVNSPMLHALCSRPDVVLQDIVQVSDDPALITRQLADAAQSSDLIVSTGGVSVGEEDHLLNAVRAAQGQVQVSGVAIKPGKPVAFGQIGAATWLGLPGNPGAAFVTWTLFGEAILRQLTGADARRSNRRHVVLGHGLRRNPGRCELRAACITGMDGKGREIVELPTRVTSGQVATLARADGLAFLPVDADHLPEGAMVEFLPFCQN